MLLHNVRVVNKGFFGESRCFLEGFDEVNDRDPTSKKRGIRCHSWITALFFSIFQKIEKKDTDNGPIYLNRGSLDKWRRNRWDNMPEEDKPSSLPTAEEIVTYYKQIRKNKVASISLCQSNSKSEKRTSSTSGSPLGGKLVVDKGMLPNSSGEAPDEGLLPNISTELSPQEQDENNEDTFSIDSSFFQDRSVVVVGLNEIHNGKFSNISKESEHSRVVYSVDSSESDKVVENEGTNTSPVNKKAQIVNKIATKVIEEAFPEIKMLNQIEKTTQTAVEVLECCQKGDILGVAKKVALPATVGVALWFGGPVVATGLAVYKVGSLAKLGYDTWNAFGNTDDNDQVVEEESAISTCTVEELDETV